MAIASARPAPAAENPNERRVVFYARTPPMRRARACTGSIIGTALFVAWTDRGARMRGRIRGLGQTHAQMRAALLLRAGI